MDTLLISPKIPELPSRNSLMIGSPDNTGRVLTKRIRHDRSTVILSFKSIDANAMRSFIKSIRLKGDKAPSQSLIARRALQVYLHRMEMLRREAPGAFDAEIEALERMVTSVPAPAREDQKKTRQGAHS